MARRSLRISKDSKTIRGAPGFFTALNLLCGYKSILSTLKGDFVSASWCIVFSMIFDWADGKLARKLGTASELGLQLDSVVDAVSFGAAPSVLLYAYAFQNAKPVFALLPFIYLLSVVYRLARFNLWVERVPKGHYPGLSSPSSAAFVVSVILICDSNAIRLPTEFFVAATFVLSTLMVSRIKYPSFKGKGFSERWEIGLFLFAVGLLIFMKYYALFALSFGYALTGPLRVLLKRDNTKGRAD